MPDWFAAEAFWAAVYPFEFPDPVVDAGMAQVDRPIGLAGGRAGDTLDLGCGPGRHTVPLARRGFRVTAVDLWAFDLARARERVVAAGVDELVQANTRAFARPEAFDLALGLFTTLGYFEDARDDLRVLQNVHHSLRPGGCS